MGFINRLANRSLDGRWFLTGSHILLLLVSIVSYHLQRTYTQILFGLACAWCFEALLYYKTTKYARTSLRDRLFSATAECAGLLILLKTHLWWFYGFASLVAIGSKYAFRRDHNRHVFNPTNFAITLSVSFLPSHWFAVWADEYMISWYPMLHVTCFGVLAVWLARSWLITVSYFVGLLIAFIPFFAMKTGSDWVYALGPEVGAAGLIFMFLMVTDPKSSPRQAKYQIVYGCAIAFLQVILRHQEYLYSRYISLFAVTLVSYALQLYRTQLPVVQKG